MKTLLVKEVVQQVNGLNSEKTLKRWTSIVKQHFGSDYFKVENVPFNRVGNKRPVITYSLDDVKRFQCVADTLATQPTNQKDLKSAIALSFGSDTLPVSLPKKEWELALDVTKDELTSLRNEDARLLRAIQEINRKISQLNELLEVAQENKPKLFMKK
jgi:hypothetical protein